MKWARFSPTDSEGRSNNSADLCSHQQGQECVSMIVHTTDLPIQKKITLYYNLYCQCSKVIRSNSRVQNYRCLCGCKKEDCNIGGSPELKLMGRQTKLGLLGQTFAVWQCRLWSFQVGGTKLERFLPKNQHTERKFLNFENWINT